MNFWSGRHHLKVPRDPYANVRWRRALLGECERSASARRAVAKACSEDVLFWFDAFVWQTNPNVVGAEDGPWVTHPFQAEAIDLTFKTLLRDRRSMVWEKSRMQGGTMMAAGMSLWLCRFHTRKRVIMMSHNRDAVERSEDEDTMFGKIDFVLNHMPSWMSSEGEHYSKVKGVYRFHEAKSQVVGTATTLRSGVGNRATMIFPDEFSKYQNAKKIREQMKETGPACYVGTHYGVGGEFYDMCRTPEIPKCVLHWSKNPMFNKGLYRSAPGVPDHERLVDRSARLAPDYKFVRDGSPHGGPFPGLRSPYYDWLCLDRTAREIAMHWDIDPAGSARQVYDQQLIRTLVMKYARDPVWRGDLEFDPNGRPTRLVQSDDGPLKFWIRPLATQEQTTGPIAFRARWVSPSEYKAGCDVSAGTGATPSCVSVWDSLTGRKVVEYANAHVGEEKFATMVSALCWVFKTAGGEPAELIFDATGPTGANFKRQILQIGFRRLYYWRDDFEMGAKVSSEPGWYANPDSIRALHRDYEEALRKGYAENPSEISLKECLAFEYIEGGNYIEHGESIRTDDPTAGRVNHSDIAQADALGWKLCKDSGTGKPNEERYEESGPPPGSLDWYIQQEELLAPKDPFRR